jgi:heat shock protein HslJ
MQRTNLFVIIVTVLIAGSILSACSLLGGGSDLVGTTWQLKSMNNAAIVDGTNITLNFDKDALGGSGGCNSYGGDYKLQGEKLTVSSVFSTEMYCEAAGLMDQEAAYYEMLNQVTGLSLDGDVLTLTTGDGGSMVFQRLTVLPD